jgi:hypothetical protein
VKINGLDAETLCLGLERFIQGNKDALAIVCVPIGEREQLRAIYRQREQKSDFGIGTIVCQSQPPAKSW